MSNYTVEVSAVKDVPVADRQGKFATVTRVTIMVGEHGPFTKDFPEGANSPEVINAWKQVKANEVRAITGN